MTRSDPLDELPVRIQGVEVQDPILILFGADWGLTIACPWAGITRGRSESWEDHDIEEWSSGFVGQELVAVRQHGSVTRFVFAAGALTAHADTDGDPWVLQLPDGLVVGRKSHG